MNDQLTSLVIDVRPGERIILSELVSVELIQKSGRAARLRVLAPREVEVKKDFSDAVGFRGKHAKLGIS